MPKLTDNEITELAYMQMIGYKCLEYAKRWERWVAVSTNKSKLCCLSYDCLDRTKDYSISALLNQNNRKGVNHKGVNK